VTSVRRRTTTWIAAVATVAAAMVAPGITPAHAVAAPEFGCMDTNGLMNLQDADDLLAGDVKISSSVQVTLGANNNVSWAQTQLDDGSARLLYSLKWVEELVREWRRTGTDAYLDKAVGLTLDFIADNPADGGPDPTDAWYPMYAGQRTTTLACVYAASGNSSVGAALSAHGAWLAGKVRSMPVWNQAIDPNLGLLAAGCDRGIASYRSLASSEFDRQISGQIDAGGVLNEQAPGYGRFVWERWGAVADKMADCGLTPPSAIAVRRAALLDWLAWASDPSGRVAPIGDSYASIVPPTPIGAPTVWTTSQGASGTKPSTDVMRVFDGGWVFGRSSWDQYATSTWWSLRFGPARDLHGHEDHQSVTLWIDGREVLVDSGHAGYADATYREALRGAQAHNILHLPDEEFRIRRATALTRTDSGAGWQFNEVRDDALGIQDNKVVDAPRTRGVLMLPGHDAMVVQDRATRATSGLFEQLWHLPPGSTIKAQSRSAVIARHPSGQADIHVVQVALPGEELPRGSTSTVTGQTNPYLGWYSDEPNQRTAAPVVRMRRVGTETRMITVIATTRVGKSIQATPVATAAGWQISLTVDGKTADVGVSRTGAMRLGAAEVGSTPPPSGATMLHGDWDGDGDDERGWFKDGLFALDPGNGGATYFLQYGESGDDPVTGDWNGDGVDTIGVRRGNLWILRSEYRRGAKDVVMRYGEASDDPVVGDWNGDGKDTLGVRRGSQWILRSRYVRGAKDVVMSYGEPTDVPVTGDWDGNGTDTLGVRRGSQWILRSRYVRGAKDVVMSYGETSDTPIVGDYDGDGKDTLGVRRGRLWILRDEYKRGAQDRIFSW
jgi:hypothetical protein